MSDTEKDRPESPKDVEPEAKPSGGGAVVISIEQARAELLAKPRQRATPQMGVMRSRPRAREVPAPVTMPPGEHTAFIVTDTPAARAHVDKKTVHPGEMPVQTHDKKVRVKTSLDPRRAKTQMSDRRGAPESPGPAPGEGEPLSLWHPTSQPPPPAQPAASPASIPPRLSLARPKPIPRDKAGVPLFVIGVIIAASVGAAVVYILGRTGAPGTASPTATVAATSPPAAPPASSPAATARGGATTAAAAPSTSATATEAPSTSAAVPTAASSAPSAVKSTAPAVKPSTAPTLAPTATAKPTATSVLPFGVGHD